MRPEQPTNLREPNIRLSAKEALTQIQDYALYPSIRPIQGCIDGILALDKHQVTEKPKVAKYLQLVTKKVAQSLMDDLITSNAILSVVPDHQPTQIRLEDGLKAAKILGLENNKKYQPYLEEFNQKSITTKADAALGQSKELFVPGADETPKQQEARYSALVAQAKSKIIPGQNDQSATLEQEKILSHKKTDPDQLPITSEEEQALRSKYVGLEEKVLKRLEDAYRGDLWSAGEELEALEPLNDYLRSMYSSKSPTEIYQMGIAYMEKWLDQVEKTGNPTAPKLPGETDSPAAVSHPVEAPPQQAEYEIVVDNMLYFPQLASFEKSLESIPLVKSSYVRDFRHGKATLIVRLKDPETADNLVSLITSLPDWDKNRNLSIMSGSGQLIPKEKPAQQVLSVEKTIDWTKKSGVELLENPEIKARVDEIITGMQRLIGPLSYNYYLSIPSPEIHVDETHRRLIVLQEELSQILRLQGDESIQTSENLIQQAPPRHHILLLNTLKSSMLRGEVKETTRLLEKMFAKAEGPDTIYIQKELAAALERFKTGAYPPEPALGTSFDFWVNEVVGKDIDERLSASQNYYNSAELLADLMTGRTPGNTKALVQAFIDRNKTYAVYIRIGNKQVKLLNDYESKLAETAGIRLKFIGNNGDAILEEITPAEPINTRPAFTADDQPAASQRGPLDIPPSLFRPDSDDIPPIIHRTTTPARPANKQPDQLLSATTPAIARELHLRPGQDLLEGVKEELSLSRNSKETLAAEPEQVVDYLKTLELPNNAKIQEVFPQIQGNHLILNGKVTTEINATVKILGREVGQKLTPTIEFNATAETDADGHINVTKYNVKMPPGVSNVIEGKIKQPLANLHQTMTGLIDRRIDPDWGVTGFHIVGDKLALDFTKND